MFQLLLQACLLGQVSSTPPAAADGTLSIEIKPIVKDSKPRERRFAWNEPGLDKRIKDLNGKPVLELLGNKLSIQLLENRPVLSNRKTHYTGTDFLCAILRGNIVPKKEMVYHLQDSEECLVRATAGEFVVGIYYRPVGYIILPNGECYWFFFERDRK